ncbi:hypothetical protein AHF37_11729 [Paragonimus kellicotti]|nr:hypothetical protein AHF37_11729 [Paragonimus kellicotti]
MHTPRTLGYCMNVVLRNTLLSLQERAAMNEQLNLRLSTITFEKLAHMVAQANVICDFVFSKGVFFFVLPKVPPKHIFWRLTLEIYCRYTKHAEVVCTRTMSPKEFLILHSELQRVKQSLDTDLDIRAVTKSPEEQDLCCICFDRVPDIVLPCLHIFCQTCIQQC